MAQGAWDRVLAFLGFDEEEPETEEVDLGAPPVAPVNRGAVAPALRGEAVRRRPVRSAQAYAEERPLPERAVMRQGNLTRLVPGFPGMVVAVPRRFEDGQECADQLKAGKPVLLHLDGIERDLAQKLVHFLMGSVYALGGEMHRVGGVVLFAPAGVDVTLPLSLRLSERDTRELR